MAEVGSCDVHCCDIGGVAGWVVGESEVSDGGHGDRVYDWCLGEERTGEERRGEERRGEEPGKERREGNISHPKSCDPFFYVHVYIIESNEHARVRFINESSVVLSAKKRVSLCNTTCTIMYINTSYIRV